MFGASQGVRHYHRGALCRAEIAVLWRIYIVCGVHGDSSSGSYTNNHSRSIRIQAIMIPTDVGF